MSKNTKIIVIFAVVACLILSFALGYYVGSDKYKSILSNSDSAPQTFYAEVKEINGDHFLVAGLEVNDINFRGEFTFTVSEDTILVWRGTAITLDDIDVGDTVSITYSGSIRETAPAGISEVDKIQLLEDEK